MPQTVAITLPHLWLSFPASLIPTAVLGTWRAQMSVEGSKVYPLIQHSSKNKNKKKTDPAFGYHLANALVQNSGGSDTFPSATSLPPVPVGAHAFFPRAPALSFPFCFYSQDWGQLKLRRPLLNPNRPLCLQPPSPQQAALPDTSAAFSKHSIFRHSPQGLPTWRGVQSAIVGGGLVSMSTKPFIFHVSHTPSFHVRLHSKSLVATEM